MKTRVISGLVMIPLLAILYFGGYVLTAACFLIGIMGVREFYNGFHAMGVKPNYGIAVAAAAALYIINIFGEKSEWYMLWFFGVVLVSMLYLFNIEHRKLEDAMATITGIFYVVFFSFHVTLVDWQGTLRTDAVAHSDNGVWNGYHGIFFRISAGKTQTLSAYQPEENHRRFYRRCAGKCDFKRTFRLVLPA